MGLIETTFSTVVAALTTTTTFLRTSKLEEANKELTQIDIGTNPIALYYNLPEADGILGEGGRVIESHPIEIAFVKKAVLDSLGTADDTIRDSMKLIATEFYNTLVKSYSSIFEKFEGNTLEAVSMDKTFSVIAVGYVLKFDLKLLQSATAQTVTSTVSNSDASYTNSVLPGATLALPDITVTLLDTTTIDTPSVRDIDSVNYISAAVNTALGKYSSLVRAEKVAIADFVRSQELSGNLTLIDCLYLFGLQTEANALISLVGSFTATAVNEPTFTAGTGFGVNGSTQYVNPNYNLSTDAVKFSLNDALLGAFVKSNSSTSNAAILGADEAGVGNSQIFQIFGTSIRNNLNTELTTNDDLRQTSFAADSLYVAARENATQDNLFINGVGNLQNDNSEAIPNADVYIGARNLAGAQLFIEATLSSFVAGAAIGFNQSNFFNNLVILNTALAAI